jgi:hypothetical protein
MPWAAAAIAGSAVIGGATSLIGSSMAADASKDAADLQNQRYATTRGDLSPYFQPGYNALNDAYGLARLGPTGGGPDYLSQAAGNLPGRMTQAELEATPGYQFDLREGLKAVQSSAAARGLGVSGASLKGAANFATGLANKTYLDQFNVGQKRFEDYLNLNTGQQGNVTNSFNRLNAIAGMGANAAAGLGTTGAGLANTAGNYINQGGLASAAGLQGVGNAVTGGVNNYLGYNALQNYLGGQTKGYDSSPVVKNEQLPWTDVQPGS